MQIRRYQEVVRERRAQVITTPSTAAGIVAPLIGRELVENFGILTLDVQHQVIAWQHLTRGTLSMTVVHPRDVFRAAISDNAAAVICAHNHPSGDCRPSADDLAITRRLVSCGELMGITVLDHVIVAYADHNQAVYTSIKELL